MIDHHKAMELAVTYLNSCYEVEGDELVIIEEATIERDYGWIFFFNSKRFLTTLDLSDMVAGGGPVLVERENGHIVQFPSAQPAEVYITEYEKQRQQSSSDPG